MPTLRRSIGSEVSQVSKWTLLRQVEGLLKAIDPSILLEGISASLSGEPDPNTCGILAEVLATFHYVGEDRREEMSPENKGKVHEYVNRSISMACEPDRINASERAYLALLLSQVGGQADLPDIRRLIQADLSRMRAVVSARERGKSVGMPMSYSNFYVNSLATAGGDGADDTFLELLAESEYERVVGEALIRRARVKEASPGIFESSRINFSEIWAAREGKPERRFLEERRRRYSAALRERLEALQKENETATKEEPIRYRIKQLATTLAVLDAPESATRIIEVFRITDRFDGYNRVASLESLVHAGVLLSHAETMDLLGSTIEELRKDLSNDQNRWLLVRCLSLLMFTSEPAEGAKKIGEIIAGSRFFIAYGAEGLIKALGASRCGAAMELLMSLAGEDGSKIEPIREPWLKAVAQLGGEKSDAVLLSFVDPASKIFTREFAPDYRDGEQLAQLLFQRAERNFAFKTRLFGLADRSDLTQRNRALLAKTYSLFQKDEDALSGLHILRDEALGIPYEIYKSIENKFLQRRPYGPSGNIYTIVPSSANALRKRLFEMSSTDTARKRSAFELLGRIEEWRLQYGRPSDEPRHPDIESGTSWPPLFT